MLARPWCTHQVIFQGKTAAVVPTGRAQPSLRRIGPRQTHSLLCSTCWNNRALDNTSWCCLTSRPCTARRNSVTSSRGSPTCTHGLRTGQSFVDILTHCWSCCFHCASHSFSPFSCCGEAGTTPWNQPLDIGYMRWKACVLEFLSETTAEVVINGTDQMGFAETAPHRTSLARGATSTWRAALPSTPSPSVPQACTWTAHSCSDQAHLAPDDEPENDDMWWDSEDEALAVEDTQPELEEADVMVSTWPAEASTPALSKWLAVKLIWGNPSARDLAKATS